MDKIVAIVEFVRSIPGGDVAIVVSSLIGLASVIVKLTPTPKDDAILGKIKKFIGKYIALN